MNIVVEGGGWDAENIKASHEDAKAFIDWGMENRLAFYPNIDEKQALSCFQLIASQVWASPPKKVK